MSSQPQQEPNGLGIGTREYRARHIALLWSRQLWHEAVMVGFGAFSIFLLFYAIAKVLRP